MEDNSMFKIPMSSSVADVKETKINAVEISSAPYEIQNQNTSAHNKGFEFYDELTAISEEVISCRNATLGRA